ncbi:hypothetical protein GCM10009840_32220 [Pseudolysinimonas kribbensis]
MAVVAVGIGSVSAAQAVTNYSGARLAFEQTFFAYAAAGELPRYTFTQVSGQNTPVTFTITAPDGAVQQTCTVPASSPANTTCTSSGLTPSVAGVWTIHYDPHTDAPAARYNWTLDVVDGEGTVIPGRTWVETYGIYQSSAANMQLWIGTREGYVYKADFRGYNGLGSWIKANGFGLVDAGTCTPIYHSVEGSISGANGTSIDPRYAYSDQCGDQYKLFLEEPDTDLPATALTPTGTDWVRPAVVPPAASNLGLQQDSPSSRAGDVAFDLAGVNGGYTLQIDTNDNGVFTDPVDRTIPWGSPPGHVEVPFDGLDGQGAALDPCSAMNAKVVVDRVGEAHIVLDDVESLGTSSVTNYGIKITGDTPGVVAPNPKLYWDDTTLTPRNSTEKPLPYADGRAGVDTTTTVTGAHGWGQWGDTRSIENWTYYQAQAGGTFAIPPSCTPGISIVKSATPDDPASYTLNRVIDYSFVVTNTGDEPLTDVDVAETAFNGTGPAPQPSCPGGILAPQQQVTCTATYTLTQPDVDRGHLDNTAVASGTGQISGGEVTSDPGSVTIPGDPDAVGSISLAKTATPSTATAAGDTVTFSFAITNTGPLTLHDPQVVESSFSGSGAVSALSCPPELATLIPGETRTCTATYRLTQADVDAGGVTNRAVARALSPSDTQVESSPSSAAVTVTADPGISLVKTADRATVAGAGQTIHYSFAVTNTGNVSVHGVSISEVAFSGAGATTAVDCPATPIAPQDTVVCTADYRTLQADVSAGTIINTAQASAISPADATLQSDPSSATVTVGPAAPDPSSPVLASTGGPDLRWMAVLALLFAAAGGVLMLLTRRRFGRG